MRIREIVTVSPNEANSRKPPTAEAVLYWIPAFAGMTYGRAMAYIERELLKVHTPLIMAIGQSSGVLTSLVHLIYARFEILKGSVVELWSYNW